MDAQTDLFDRPAPAVRRDKEERPLWKHQREAHEAAVPALKSKGEALVILPTGGGKCLGRGTPVLMATGEVRNVENIVAGEMLCGADGDRRRVLATSSGTGELFRITPVKGDSWVCNDVHILTLVHTESGEVEDIPLNEYIKKSAYWKHCRKMFREPVPYFSGETPRYSLPIDPYFLGLAIGDGSLKRGVVIFKPDKEVKRECEEQAINWGLHVNVLAEGTSSVGYQLSSSGGAENLLFTEIKSLGLNVGADQKFIPDMYKLAHPACRVEILAGLMDSDGHLSHNGFDFISSSERLASDVVFVARSCGLAAYMKRCRKGCQGGHVGDYYRVSISGHTSCIPTRIQRKKAKRREQKKDVLRTGFSVSSVGVGEYFGFELDGDGRFLLGDFTVTHNTRLFNEVINTIGEPALIIAHRDNLITQAVDRARRETNLTVGIEKAWQFGGAEDIIVASIQTLSKSARLERFQRDRFGVIVVDEAHHSAAVSYRKVLNYFDAKKLGVTATPDRTDEKKIANIFGRPVYVYETLDAIKDGVLCDIVCHRAVVAGLDMSTVKTAAGDYDQEDLDNAFKVEGVLQGVADTMLKEAGDRRTIIFSTSIQNAKRLAEIMNRHRYGCAMEIHSKLDDFEVACRMKQHAAGEYQFLINVGIATEGYDDPRVSCIGLARPTQSRPLCAQMVGRGLRSASGKVDCKVIDFTGNLGIRHNLCTPVDLLGSQFDEEVIGLAEKIVGENKGTKVTDALAAAKEQEERRKREALAIASRIGATATAIYSKSKVDPFAVLRFGEEAERQRALDKRFGGSVPTDGQIEALKKFGVPITKMLTHNTAGALIGKLKERAALGLASYKQVAALRRSGIDAESFKRELASKAIDAVSRNGWRPLPPWKKRQFELEAINGNS